MFSKYIFCEYDLTMTDERSRLIYLLNISFSDNQRHLIIGEEEENIQNMKRIIEINPQLSDSERNLLSCVYKWTIVRRREVLRNFNEFLDEAAGFPARIQQLGEFKQKLIQEIDSNCEDLCRLIEEQLLPIANNAEERVFYEKMEADYYRYMAEFHTDELRDEIIQKAAEHYETALAISKAELPQATTLALGLILNYSVFLYEMMERHQEAIDLASTACQETVDLMDTLSDNTYQDTSKIIYLLRDNCKNWQAKKI